MTEKQNFNNEAESSQKKEKQTEQKEEKNEEQEDVDQNEEGEMSLEEKCEDYKEKWLRAQADYRNLKKSISEKRDKWKQRSEFRILEEFIPVFDHFKKAYQHKPAEDDGNLEEWQNWAEGMGYILKQFNDILDDYGVEPIEAEGEEFDPGLHTATMEKNSEEVEEGRIIEVMEQGYKTEEKILKPARVVVSKGEDNSEEQDSEE